MTIDWNLMLAALLASLTVCGTPGPNNIICASIGAQKGYRGALPYSLGVTVGFPIMLAAMGTGLGAVIQHNPQIQQVMQVLGAAFLTYLAYRIATAPMLNMQRQAEKVDAYGFKYAVFFQWVNPKAISYAFSLIALYTRPHALLLDIALLMLISAAITLPITMTWALAGDVLGRFLQTPLRYRLFNVGMALLLLLAAISVFFG